MELLRRTLGKVIALALEGIDMEKYGFVILLRHLKRFAELLDIVPVNRTDIVKSEILEPRIGIDNALQCALYIKRGIRKLISDDRDMFQELFGVRFHAVIFRFRSDDGKITRHEPTFSEIDISLSLSTIMSLSCVLPALFKAS